MNGTVMVTQRGVVVPLAWSELRAAMYAGNDRFVRAYANGRARRWGQARDDLNADVWGAIGECVVAKTTNTYWPGDTSQPDGGGPDVGPWHVRCTPRRDGRLILHPEDTDTEPFVLVVPDAAPATFLIVGWCDGFEGKLPDYWQDPTGTGRPAFFVPREALHPFDVTP